MHLIRLLIGLVILLALTAPSLTIGSPTAAASIVARDNDNDNDDSSDEEDLQEFIDATIDAANAFWAGQFARLGRAYRPPQVVVAAADERVRSKCGNSRGASHSYCPEEETIYVDYDSDDETSFVNLWDDDRSFVIVTTLGHEWGHHVQNLLDLLGEDDRAQGSIYTELQADCLMGVFARDYQREYDWVERVDIVDAITDTEESGDDPDAPMSEMTHGTPTQRVEAFLRGYNAANIAACGIDG